MNYQYFLGEWRLERKFGGTSHASGKAEFTSDDKPQRLFYKESLSITDMPVITESVRAYFYDFKDNIITKRFTDESKFYSLESNGNKAIGYHKCKNDEYHAEYEVFDDKFLLKYIVKGPRKDYVIENLYIRTSVA